MEPDATVLEPLHSGLSTVEESALRSQNKACGIPIIGNETIHRSTAPSLMLLQQHMEGIELRELISQLSDTQSCMMDILQALIEPHSGGNLNSLQMNLIWQGWIALTRL